MSSLVLVGRTLYWRAVDSSHPDWVLTRLALFFSCDYDLANQARYIDISPGETNVAVLSKHLGLEGIGYMRENSDPK
jgi:hypothetical protein